MAQKELRLNKYDVSHRTSTPQNCKDEGSYYSDGPVGKRTVIVSVSVRDGGESVHLRTKKGDYVLQKHPVCNYHCGTVNGMKIHVILRPMVGRIIFWTK